MARVEWKGKEFEKEVDQVVKDNLLKIGWKMVAEIKESMKGYGAYSNISTHETVKGSKRTKSGNMHYPSPPGGAPAVDTGRLRSSITINWTGSGLDRASVQDPVKESQSTDGLGQPGQEPGKFIVIVGTNVEYAPHLELGTSKMSPRPFLRPIFEAHKREIQDVLKKR